VGEQRKSRKKFLATSAMGSYVAGVAFSLRAWREIKPHSDSLALNEAEKTTRSRFIERSGLFQNLHSDKLQQIALALSLRAMTRLRLI